MVIAVVLVRVMELPVHQVIFMVSMWYALVAAVGPVHVSAAALFRRATFRICASRAQPVIVHVIAVNVMQVTIVQVIRVAVVLNGHMSAIRSVLVSVTFVTSAGCHTWVSHW
jgi:hypothetical protein